MHRTLLPAILAIVSLAPSGALAQESADALIDEGVRLREQGRDAEALERFRRARDVSPSQRALAQQALAEQALGRWVDAYEHLVQALASGDDPWIARNRAQLEGARARIREHVAELEVVDGVAGAEVWINGERVGDLPLPRALTVPSGTVVLEVRALGYVPLRRTIEMRGGGRARESVALVASAAPVEEPVGEPRGTRSGSPAAPSPAGPDAGSIAGASVLGAAGLAGVAVAIAGIAGAGCLLTEGGMCIEERTTNWDGVGAYGGVGLAAVAGAVVWLVVALSAGSGEPSPTALRLAPNGVAWSF